MTKRKGDKTDPIPSPQVLRYKTNIVGGYKIKSCDGKQILFGKIANIELFDTALLDGSDVTL